MRFRFQRQTISRLNRRISHPSACGAAEQVQALERRVLLAATPAATAPFGGTPQGAPGTLEFENYDTGGEGVAYHDTTPANEGGQFRQDGVDLGQASDAGGGYFVGWTNPGEW